MEISPVEEDLIVIQKRTGIVPDMLTTRPKLITRLREIWEIFLICHKLRGTGMQAERIAMSEILSVFELYEIRDYFVRMYYARMVIVLDDRVFARMGDSNGNSSSGN